MNAFIRIGLKQFNSNSILLNFNETMEAFKLEPKRGATKKPRQILLRSR